MNLKRLEILSWRVYRLWEEELPRFRLELREVGSVIAGKTPRDRPYILEVLHVLQDAICNGIEIFHYTLGHILVWYLAYKALAAGLGAAF